MTFVALRHLLLNNFSLVTVVVTLYIIFTSGLPGLDPLRLVLAFGAFLILLFDVDNVLVQEVVR